MMEGIGKTVCTIETEDLRTYLSKYQAEKESSKVTIDNIRRIFSSFLHGWKTRITSSKVRYAEYIELSLPVL